MDFTMITNNISFPQAYPVKNSQSNIIPAENIKENNKNEFDYNDVMMNLEEIQDFLFMMLGIDNPTKAGKADKGINVDLLA